MNCPNCSNEMEKGFLYVRGFAGSLFWSTSGHVRFFSREGLQQIDLSRLSQTPTGAQAVLPASRCSTCSMIAFKSTYEENGV